MSWLGKIIWSDSTPLGLYKVILAEGAELKALQLLKKHEALQFSEEVRRASIASVHFEEIVEVSESDVSDQQPGLSVFPMDE